jgi:maltose alpha-D-glucosyltransferase / alpha-amylase
VTPAERTGTTSGEAAVVARGPNHARTPRGEREVASAAGAPAPFEAEQWFESDPLWFKSATFYEIHVRGFFDGNADGSGDFRGLTEKLDYLEWLGIDCIWLLPMYPSPLRDGGYDTSDFNSIHADYGTVDDVREFIAAAHERGIRVIADLVMNHTSSDHAWFQEARSSPDSPKRNWYVWSDTNDRYRDSRVIFVDTETSNWTWDEQAGAYYWHRFFHHQPDLNYDETAVQEAMLDTLRFWLDLGLDGFRLDAVPYLFEREGTNCENLPETHEFLRRVRATIDTEYPDKVLLAEANQWPADVVQYFGAGDECHMAFHFPVMPRMFMALRRERAAPIVEILERTPAIPENCQWGLFLRNHDELTLEMVTDEERDYMYDEYARDPRMKLNVGIRRRLAPLLDNDRSAIELLTAIMFSLPGSPVLYYGDEIAMGDNVYLGDRDGVRTPMQWTGDRNGGFSRADFAQLYAPPLMDPVYGFQAVNIEAQLRTPASLLRWLRRFIGLRKEHPVFGQPAHLRARPPVPGRHRRLRAQPRAHRAGGRARPFALARPLPRRDGRPDALPPDRRAALPPDAASARLLLVPAGRRGGIRKWASLSSTPRSRPTRSMQSRPASSRSGSWRSGGSARNPRTSPSSTCSTSSCSTPARRCSR